MNTALRALLAVLALAVPAFTGSAAAQTTPVVCTDRYALGFGNEQWGAAGGIAINDACDVVTATFPSTSRVMVGRITDFGIRDFFEFRARTPVGIDFTPGARMRRPLDGVTGLGRIYIANFAEPSIAFIELAEETWEPTVTTVTVPLPTGATHRPTSVAVAQNGTVLVATNAGNTRPYLFQFNPATGTFRDRTGEIPGGIAGVTIKASPDRATIGGIWSGTRGYAYDAATDSFVATANDYYSGGYFFSAYTADRAYRITTSPHAGAGSGTVAIQNVATGAIVARNRSGAQPAAANGPIGMALSRDGSLFAYSTPRGFVMARTKPQIDAQFWVNTALGGRSVIRIHNSGAMAAPVTVSLTNADTGAPLGVWTSPIIPGGASVQYHVVELERALALSPTSIRYQVKVRAPRGFFGSAQHLIWTPDTGTLANVTACDRGHYDSFNYNYDERAHHTTDPHQLAGVHSSVFTGYPSTITLTRWDDAAAAEGVPLTVYDGRNGVRLGVYTTAAFRGKETLNVPVRAIEQALGLSPAADHQYYVIIAPATFKGFLQHRMDSDAGDVTTDLSLVCGINSEMQLTQNLGLPDGPPLNTVDIGGVHSTAQTEQVSFFHIVNDTLQTRTVTATLNFNIRGTHVSRTWTSPTIPAEGELQVLVSDIERGSGPDFEKPAFYEVSFDMPFQGAVQHYVWRPGAQTLVNASTCSATRASDPRRLGAVHSSMYANDYPSFIVIHSNPGFGVGLRVTATTGERLGTYEHSGPAAGGHVIVSVAEIERALNITPSWDRPRYNLYAGLGLRPGGKEGSELWLQHLVVNLKTGMLEDMTQTCRPFRSILGADYLTP